VICHTSLLISIDMANKQVIMKTFNYQKSFQIIHWGCSFDSLLELKYALFIHEDYEFLRAQIPIYYDPKTKTPTNYIRNNIRRYTPDLLIRNKQTKQAFLVELKPRAFADQDQLKERKEIAEKYIQWKGWDWSFIIVFDDEFKLNSHQGKQFQECCKLIGKSERKLSFEKLNKWFDRSQPSFFKKVPSNAQVRFIMYGN
jgi:hypothetical protein